ncbi:MAG TPA: hypothetical protein EYN91_11720 [Candidatus Melainabacteria bacterium]|jgi:hypothetical protein|nr:hypothetical protein [Candidatus Melainabacteria bacterium]HIN67245.1 hypothetical protein [Candidatus Obscuribacterales bacterium]
MPEQYKVEGEMLASKVNEGLNLLRTAYRAANPEKCEEFEDTLMDYFGTVGFGTSMGYFVEKVHPNWPTPESQKMRFPGPGCLHLSPAVMQPGDIQRFLNKIGELTHDPDGYLTGPFIYWSWAHHSWLKADGSFSAVIEVTGIDPVTMPYDWCVLFCGTNLCLYLWGSRA